MTVAVNAGGGIIYFYQQVSADYQTFNLILNKLKIKLSERVYSLLYISETRFFKINLNKLFACMISNSVPSFTQKNYDKREQ